LERKPTEPSRRFVSISWASCLFVEWKAKWKLV